MQKQIVAAILAMLAAVSFAASPTQDENGLVPYYWYKFNGNTTSSGAADSSIVWRIKRYTTGRNDLAALGSDTHYTSVTPLSLGSGALLVPLLTAESNDNLFDDWRAYDRVLSVREIAKLAGLRVNKGFILGVR